MLLNEKALLSWQMGFLNIEPLHVFLIRLMLNLLYSFTLINSRAKPRESFTFVRNLTVSRQLCNRSPSIQRVFKKQPSHILFKKATNLIKAIRKSELTGNAHDSLYMLQYFFLFLSYFFSVCYFFVCCSIVCLYVVRKDTNALFQHGSYNHY